MADISITIDPPNTNSIILTQGLVAHNTTHAPGGSDSLATWYALAADLTGISGQISFPSNVVFTTGDQTVGGVKDFSLRPTVNGTGVLLSGEASVPNTGYLTGYVSKTETGSFLTSSQTGSFLTSGQTGVLTGSFYPLNSNPSGYVVGAVVRPSNTGEFVDKGSAQRISGKKTFSNYTSFLNQIQVSGFEQGSYSDNNSIAFIDPLYEVTGLLIYGGGSDLGGGINASNEGSLDLSAGAFVTISGGQSVRVFGSNLTGDRFAVFPSGVSGNNLVYNTSNQTISGLKNFTTRPTINGTGVLLSGEASAASTGYLTGYTPIVDSITGISVDGSSTKTITLYQYDGSTLTASFTDQQGTGAGSDFYIYSGSFNAADGNLTLNRTGDGGTVVVSLDGRYVTGSVVRPSDTGSFVTNGQTGNFITSSQTGVFYPTSNPSGYITTSDLSPYSTIVSTTGISGYLQTQITTNNATGAFLTTGAADNRYALQSATGAYTGAFYPRSSNPSNYLVAADLSAYATQEYVTGISGYQSGLITNLQSATGNLNTRVTSIESVTGTFALSANTGAFLTTGAGDARYYPLSSNPSSYLVASNIADLASTGYVTGVSGYLQGQITTLNGQTGNYVTGSVVRPSETGNFVTVSQTGQFYAASNPQGFITNSSLAPYATTGYVTGVSGYLESLISASSAGVGSLNGLSGVLTIAGAGNNSVSVAGSTITVSGNTGFLVNYQQTGNYITTAQTGDFYAASNPASYITTAALSPYATTVFVTGTSGHLQGQISSLQSATGSINTRLIAVEAVTGSFVTGSVVRPSETGNFITSSQTGVFYPITNPSGYITAASLSPYATTTFVTGVSGYQSGLISSLQTATGTLNTRLITVESVTGSFVTGSVVRPSETGTFLTSSSLTPYATIAFVTGISGYHSGLINTLQSSTGTINTRLTSIEGVTGSFALKSQTGAFLTTGAGDTRYALQSATGAFLTTGAADNRYFRAPYVAELYIDAGAMLTGLSGASPITTTVNSLAYDGYDFDPATTGYSQFKVTISDYNLGNIKAKFTWTAASTGSVVWGIQSFAAGDGDTINPTWSVAQEVTDTYITGSGLHRSSATSAFIPSGTVQSGDSLFFRIYRNTTSASDTVATNATLLGLSLQYTGTSVTSW